ncbi:ABC transporter ATP-binding protein [Roseateles koreensis]|uniref:ATP-binding cassette domain-containing protein n=1 Tax=Roseateles koreensis TaxID=2987526 RepID=A0ABT5KWC9_9BURK|nr:ATP-binding cassette domain-containing protein [Roseateles koreensis]MDC8786126.1 ATP-binding cassette domain-containing protein [Roseateles koreensis]
MQTHPIFCQATGLGLFFAGRSVLSDLNFALSPGLNVLRGGDGRGKTSLLRLISGTLAPTAGHISRSVSTLCYPCPEDPSHDAQPVRQWLAAQRQAYPAWSQPLEARLLQAFALSEHLDKPLYMLSTGSRRKTGLVAAAASGAQLTLLDQPYAALDARSCALLSELLAEAAEDTRRAWVLADYALPPALAQVGLRAVVDLGD